MKRFENKIVAITGSARGIGLECAKRFSKEGARVAIIDINFEAAQNAAELVKHKTGNQVHGFSSDISNLDSVKDTYKKISDEMGAPQIFVNCAAITDDKLFLDSKPADWNKIISVDLFGALNCVHTFLPSMVANQFGRIICLASDSARIGQARLSYYAAAKAGVIALVKSIAQEVGRSGVTLNIVSPGATNTEMRIDREQNLLAQMGPEKYERRQKTVLKMYPMGRVGNPEDIAASILFLSSDDASWVTGQVLSVNGGFCMP
jgi:short-subunit dehydrogenase